MGVGCVGSYMSTLATLMQQKWILHNNILTHMRQKQLVRDNIGGSYISSAAGHPQQFSIHQSIISLCYTTNIYIITVILISLTPTVHSSQSLLHQLIPPIACCNIVCLATSSLPNSFIILPDPSLLGYWLVTVVITYLSRW